MTTMRETETKPETGERGRRAPAPRPPKGKGILILWIVAAVCAAAAALAVWFAVFGQTEEVPEDVSAPPASQEMDTTPPELLGMKDITVLMGETVSYRDGVSAVDDVDGTVPFQVDAGAVDLNVPGVYQVVYSAKDAAGNRAEVTISVTVEEPLTVDQDIQESDEPTPSGSGTVSSPVTEEEVNRLCDQILGQILRDGMSQREKARAIFNYVNQHIRYVGSSDKSSWIVGAHTGFTRHRGDCYNYYACSKALLTRAGIPNIDLERVGGNSRHYWQLVNTGDGWYHFDTCPHPTGYPLVAFMITETQARTYTEQVKRARQNYYVYDYASCPVQVEGTPPEGWQPPVSTPAPTPTPVVTAPPETTEPPVETMEPPAETPEVTDFPVDPEPPVESTEPQESGWPEPPAEGSEPPVAGPTEQLPEPPVQTESAGENPPDWPEPPDWLRFGEG